MPSWMHAHFRSGMAAPWASARHQSNGEKKGRRERERTGCQMRQRAERRNEEDGEGGQQERRVFTSSESLRVCVCAHVRACVPLCARSVTCVGVCMHERKGRRQEKRQRGRESVRERVISHQ